ncbi:sodium:proton antiporter [Rhodocyclaceae bacterium SMB388]
MEWLAALTVGGLAGIGMWLLLDRNLVRVVLGVAILGNAINLGVLTSGRFAGSDAAFVTATTVPPDPANPLPQALVLTAIVIGFGLFTFALAVLKSVRESHGITTTDRVTEVTEEAAPDVEEVGLQVHQDDADMHHEAEAPR